MMSDALRNASIVALASTFLGIVPLAMGVVYAVWPSEQRLTLIRPVSLATIFAGIGGSILGLLNVFAYMGRSDAPTFSRIAATGVAEAMVPTFVAFGCLTVTWLSVALGLWRRPQA